MNKRLKKLDGMRLAFDFATTTKRPDGCFPVAVSSINPVPAGLACSTEVSLNGKRITISVKDLDGIRSLGRGQFGAVEEMIERQTGCVFAVKRIAITTDNPERPKLLNDLNVSMRSSKCPYVVTSYGALSHEGELWVIMELMDISLDKLLHKASHFFKGPICIFSCFTLLLNK